LFGLGNALATGAAGGTYFSLNAPSSFSGNFAQWLVNDQTVFTWSGDGSFSAQNPNSLVTWTGNNSTAAGSSFRLAIAGTSASSTLSFGAGARDFLVANALGKAALGTAAPQPSNADLLIRDNTPSTGDTQVQIQAGAGQQGDLLQFLDGSGAATTRVTGQAMLVLQPTGSQPACTSAQRGAFWFKNDNGGGADNIEVCRKGAGGSYSWTALLP
jgi:hypothetical protein